MNRDAERRLMALRDARVVGTSDHLEGELRDGVLRIWLPDWLPSPEADHVDGEP